MDYLESLKHQIGERFNSPLLVSFSISWAAWNYKIFFVLFSDLEPASKFTAIKDLYPDEGVLLGGGLFYPIVSAAIFIFLYPWASRQVLRYSIWQEELTQRVKLRAFEKQLLSPEQIRQLRLDYQEKIDRLVMENERKTEQSARYQLERDKAETQIVDEKAAAQKVVNEANDQLAAAIADNERIIAELNSVNKLLRQNEEETISLMQREHEANSMLATYKMQVENLEADLKELRDVHNKSVSGVLTDKNSTAPAQSALLGLYETLKQIQALNENNKSAKASEAEGKA